MLQSCGKRVGDVCKWRKRGGAEEIGTLRFGGWEFSRRLGARLGLAQNDPHRTALEGSETY
jgi:hypothetical protein